MADIAVLHQRAVDAANAGRLASARRWLARARSSPGSVDARARLEATAAYVDTEFGDLPGALARCDGALAWPGLGDDSRAVLHAQRGLIHDLAGEDRLALSDLSVAVALDADPLRRSRALLNRGMLHLDLGDIARARDDFSTARQGFDDPATAVQRAKCDHNLGIVASLSGDLVTALALMDAAAAVLAPLSDISRAIGDADRATVLDSAGLGDEAVELLAEAARLLGRHRARRLQAESELRLARALLTSDPGRSATVAARAAGRFDAMGSHGWAARARATQCAGQLTSGRVTGSEIDRTVRVLAELDAQGLSIERRALLVYLARGRIARGDLDDAAELLRGQRLDPGMPLAQRLLLQLARAEYAAASGDVGGALAQVRRGLDELHQWQRTFGSVELRSAIIGHGRALAQLGLDLGLAGTDPRRCFEWAERTGALLSRVGAVLPRMAPEQDQRLTELRVLHQRDAIDPATRRRQAELRSAIRRAAWQDRAAADIVGVTGLPALRRALRDGSATYVGYAVRGTELVAIAVSARETRVHRLGDVARASRLRDGLLPTLNLLAEGPDPVLAAAVSADLAGRLRTLSDLLVTPLGLDPGTPRLVLVAPPALGGLPWAMLPGLAGRSITLAPSASWWVQRSSDPITLTTACLLAGPGVPRGIAEVSAAGHLWQRASMLTGGAASVAGLRAAAARADLLHLAAHGRHSSSSPLFSGVELADGPFIGHDIAGLARTPTVVVLSACELGRSASHFGQETLGLTTAWLHAGARCVIASPVLVDDGAASALLTAVHRRLVSGAAPADALAKAAEDVGMTTGSTFVAHGSGW